MYRVDINFDKGYLHCFARSLGKLTHYSFVIQKQPQYTDDKANLNRKVTHFIISIEHTV